MNYSLRWFWMPPVLGMMALLLGSCIQPSSTAKFKGFYLEDASLRLDPDPNAYRPSHLEQGQHWIVWLNAHQGGRSPLSESAKRADIFIELPGRPELGQRIDLAMAPLQVSYEAGGQAITYISRKAAGTLVLRAQDDEVLIAQLDVTFSAPILGSGEQQFVGEIRLAELQNF